MSQDKKTNYVAGAGAPEIDVTPDMIEAGATRLDDLLIAGGGLMCTLTYAAEEVYLAMERVKYR